MAWVLDARQLSARHESEQLPHLSKTSVFGSLVKAVCCVAAILPAIQAESASYSYTHVSYVTRVVSCATDWVLLRETENCFKFVLVPQTWDDARQSCVTEGSDLAIISDNATAAFVEEMSNVTMPYWIGLRVTNLTNGLASWVHHEPLGNLSLWLDGQPNTDDGDCVLHWNADPEAAVLQAGWRSTNCSTKNWFICQKKPSLTYPTITKSCQAGWSLFKWTMTCFKSFQDRHTWEAGRIFCQTHGADLASMRILKSEGFVRRFLQRRITYFWIGLQHVNATGKFYWLDEIEEYSDWHPLVLPTAWDEDRYCVKLLRKYVEHKDDFVVAPCNTQLSVVCEKGPIVTETYSENIENIITKSQELISVVTLTCPDDWVLYQDGVVCLQPVADRNATRDEAWYFCRYNYDGNLITIPDFGTNQLVGSLISDNESYWIGLNDLNKDGQYTWSDGTTLGPYQPWGSSSHSVNETEQCISLRQGSPPTWSVEDCDQALPFLCQYNKTTITKLYDSIIVSGRTYFLFTEKVPYASVQSRCEEHNMTQLFPSSDEEFSSLRRWLGEDSPSGQRMDYWVRTDKLQWEVYHWHGGTAVGENYVWLNNSPGNSCFRKYAFHACCTLLASAFSFSLMEKPCDGLRAFICVYGVYTPPPSVSFLLSSSTQSSSSSSSTSIQATSSSPESTATLASMTISVAMSSTALSQIAPTSPTTVLQQSISTPDVAQSTSKSNIEQSMSTPYIEVSNSTKSILGTATTEGANTGTTSRTLTSRVARTSLVEITSSQSSTPIVSLTSLSLAPSSQLPQPTTTGLQSEQQSSSLSLTPSSSLSLTSSLSSLLSSATPSPSLSSLSSSSSSSSSSLLSSSPSSITPTSSSLSPASTTSSSSSSSSSLSSSPSPPSSSPPTPTTTPLPPLPPTLPLSQEETASVAQLLRFLKNLSHPASNDHGSVANDTYRPPNKLCPCSCAARPDFNPSPKALASMISKLQSELKVETTSLSASINKKKTAVDARPTSAGLGLVTVLCAIIPFLAVMSLDFIRVYQFFKTRSDHKRIIQQRTPKS